MTVAALVIAATVPACSSGTSSGLGVPARREVPALHQSFELLRTVQQPRVVPPSSNRASSHRLVPPTSVASRSSAVRLNWLGPSSRSNIHSTQYAALPPLASSASASWPLPLIWNFFGFAVPKAGKNADAAEKFVLYFMAKAQLSKISSEAGNMTPRTDITAPGVLASVQTALTNRTVFPDQDALMRDDSKWYTTVFQPESVAFMTGKLTPQQFVGKLKTESATFWASAAPAK